MLGRLGHSLAFEAARIATAAAMATTSVIGHAAAIGFFLLGAATFLSAGGLALLAEHWGWPYALLIFGGGYLVAAILLILLRLWRRSMTARRAAIAAAAADAAYGAHPAAPPAAGAAGRDAGMELAMMAAAAFRDGASMGRAMREGGNGRRRGQRRRPPPRDDDYDDYDYD